MHVGAAEARTDQLKSLHCGPAAPQIYALGFVSVFEQIMESIDAEERKKIFNAYITALNENPDTFRSDAAKIEQQAGSLSGPDALTPDANGSDLQVGFVGGQRCSMQGSTTRCRVAPVCCSCNSSKVHSRHFC